MLFSTAVLAERRAALVIGNAAYAYAPRALSAERDVEAVADALGAAGYDVTFGLDLDRREMRAVMDQFAAKIDQADEIVIYYSGHAVRMSGRTFLAPTDFNPVGPVSVAMDSAPLAALEAMLASKPGAAVLFLDAAQRDGFPPRSFAGPGLAALTAPKGALFVSAAEPGRAVIRSRWRMSDFAVTVVERFLSEGARTMDVARNVSAPIWATGGVDGSLTLVPRPTAVSNNSEVSQKIELAFWRSTEASGRRADYEAYLRRYPNGLFAEIARNRLGRTTTTSDANPQPTVIASSATRAAAAEEALRLSRDDRRQIQSDLTELGYDTNGVDGLFGRGTRGAVRAWQISEELPSTGYFDREQLRILAENAEILRAERQRAAEENSRRSTAEVYEQDEDDWRSSREVHTYAGYQRYLKLHPNGRYADEARQILAEADRTAEEELWAEVRRIDNTAAYANYLDRFPRGRYVRDAERRYNDLAISERRQQAEIDAYARREQSAWREAEQVNTPKSYRIFVENYPDGQYVEEAQRRRQVLVEGQRKDREKALGLSRDEWLSLEKRLAVLGYKVGDINGKPGKTFRAAVKDYRRSRGLPVHSYVDRKFVRLLVKETRKKEKTGIQGVIDGMKRVFEN